MKIIFLQILLPSPQTFPGLRTLSRLEPSLFGRRLLQLSVADGVELASCSAEAKRNPGACQDDTSFLGAPRLSTVHLWDWTSPPEQSS